MENVGEWLDCLGLGQYRSVFAAHDINSEVLRDLTDSDLGQLGLPLGHRRKLLKAIGALKPPAPPPTSNDYTQGSQKTVERRNLTVLFCDLVGSTTLSVHLDPEDLRQIILLYQDRVAAVVERFGGFVARYMGDGVLAYFGWPMAAEDDAARAVAAGLDIIEAVRTVATESEPLQARIGIATGLAIVGDLIGKGAAREETVIGEVPNMAARLQALAPPDAVLIGSSTRQLIGRSFNLESLGSVRLKGWDTNLPVWRVIAENHFPTRFADLSSESAITLIGRESELSLLHSRWQQTLRGHGQLVLVSGEAGIGKSRTTAAFTAQIRDTRHQSIVYQCLPQHTSDPLHPVIRQIEFAAGFALADPPECRLDKLEALLAGFWVADPEAAGVFADLLSLPTGARYPQRDPNPARRKARTLAVLLESLFRLASGAPLLILLEDLQWIDPTTRELFEQLVARFDGWPLMLIITARPEFERFWGDGANAAVCKLPRLSRMEAGEIIRAVAGGKSLPAEVFEQIQTKTDGVPLFVEELTKTVIESDCLTETPDRWLVRSPITLNIPATLQDSLMARLDRLGTAKELAQIAAAVGREFSRAVIAPVSGLSPARLDEGLERLVESELVLRQGETRYAFKHALVQDAAYASILLSKRRELNRRIAAVLEMQFPEIAETQPETIAYHLSEAQVYEPAIRWWRRAGQRNLHASANVEAIRYLERCLSLLPKLPAGSGDGRDLIELDIRIDLGVALMGTSGYTAPGFGDNVDRALELCERVGAHERLFPALWGQVARTFSAGEVAAALGMAQRFLQSAERQDNRQLQMIGHRLYGMTLFGCGELPAARRHTERALELYDPEQDATLRDIYGFDQRVAALAYLGRTLHQLGFPDQAMRVSEQAVAEARRFDHINTTIYAQGCILELRIMRRETTAIASAAAELARLAQWHAVQNYELVSLTCNYLLALMRDGGAAAVAGIREGIDQLRELNWNYWATRFCLLAAEEAARCHYLADARDWLEQARTLVESLGQRLCTPDLHRVTAVVLDAEHAAPAQVTASLQRAIEVAREQSARWAELRCSTSLAQLLRDQGKPGEALALLSSQLASFSEGTDLPDLVAAAQLLKSLHSAASA